MLHCFTATLVLIIFAGHDDAFVAFTISKDGSLAASATDDMTIRT